MSILYRWPGGISSDRVHVNASQTAPIGDMVENVEASGSSKFDEVVSEQTLVVVTGITTLTSNRIVMADATVAAFAISLPVAPKDAETYTIKKIDASVNAVTVDGNTHNIDGAATYALSAQWSSVKVVYSTAQTAWFIIGKV